MEYIIDAKMIEAVLFLNHRLKGGVVMINKIKSLKETKDKMECMKKEVLFDISKDIKEKRYEAFIKIFDFMDDLADGINEDITVRVRNLKFFNFDNHVYVHFNSKYCISENGSTRKYSEKPIKWFITGLSSSYKTPQTRSNFIDRAKLDEIFDSSNNRWSEGYINLLNNWEKFKEELEEVLTVYYTEKMDMINKETSKSIENYERAVNFKI